jgi:hypothetical protein
MDDILVTNTGDPVSVNNIAALAIEGSYTQNAGGTLAVELGGTGTAEFDSVDVDGVATLGGRLTVALDGGFTPTVGQSFAILTATSVSGTFSNTDDVVMTDDNSAAFRIHTNATDVTLECLEGGVTDDGTPNWWLNDKGLPLGASTTDTDGDDKTEAEEFIASTNPNDGADFFNNSVMTIAETGDFDLIWTGKLGRLYSVETSSDLATWTPVASELFVATEGSLTYEFTKPLDQKFLRIAVTRP